MPRKKVNRSPPVDKRADDVDDDDFFFDDTQSNSGKIFEVGIILYHPYQFLKEEFSLNDTILRMTFTVEKLIRCTTN